MNYGHPLEFGTFITPTGEDAVTLARRSEELGYDLVTFQDRPFQPDLHDTWTLMSWVAGRTERIHIAANVLSVPLRQPAVLARAAASLDLLSGGRLDLALGAGAEPDGTAPDGSWDAIEAMGGPRLDPDGAVDALAEAVDVVRGMLDAGEPTPLCFAGEHYRIDAVGRGPLPRHQVPIWLGGRERRVLRLIGRKADGWVVTLGHLGPGDLRAGNKIIDEAAAAAGRDPAEIRRLVNIAGTFGDERRGFLQGPPRAWVDDLLPLAVEDGAGTFVLICDDPEALERFAREVVPALRAAVDAALPAPLPTGPVRGAAARAKRRTGIDYDGLPRSLARTAVEPGDIDYPRVRANYMRGGSPGVVLRPGSTAEVAEALAFARRHPDLPMGVRSGGHGISGRSTNDGGIVIDLGALDAVEVLDEATRRVRIGPGARWKRVAAALSPYGWALTSGDYGGVGVGGLATAGGIGFLGRKHGLTIDHLRAVEMVLADGSVVRASDTENPDLFWAVRGAGANFGIVTSFEFEVDEVGAVGWAQLGFVASDMAGFLRRFGEVASTAPRDTTAFLVMGPPRRGQPAVAQLYGMVDSADPDTVIAQLQPFAQIAPMFQQEVVIAPYAEVMGMAPDAEHQGRGEPVSRSAFVREVTPAFAQAAERLLTSGVVYFFQLRTVGGAVADVDPDATAYAHRDAGFSVIAMGVDRERLDRLWDGLSEHFDGLYLSFETDQRPERLADAFPPATLRRLRELKGRYDPDNVFRDNFNIRPIPGTEEKP
ncbi:LLM class flavin-dependent oxidoreductase [Phytohabitans sp. ZYX-F-186]|uniref:LLM class flavin-dependent oxidoreductase n=1 Tax=Phytohabitans maris TaxID=3071409 RepID=A0ABU0ZJ26_9ACTN|nr:LLM class flavin-dependent oxidoreductase [Phytohabitans sp. ZYX-F-186]MDQ7906377.1 LLM class flavin-dependent oxidoreductase [Phytohabitans sp. ZYX-F-186]